jgi:DUF1680 family protein
LDQVTSALAPVALTARGVVAPDQVGSLYRPATSTDGGGGDPVALTAIPYFLWGNRAAGPMRVWVPVAPPVEPTPG